MLASSATGARGGGGRGASAIVLDERGKKSRAIRLLNLVAVVAAAPPLPTGADLHFHSPAICEFILTD